MDWQLITSLLISALALGYVARALARDWRKHTGGCAGCGLARHRKILS